MQVLYQNQSGIFNANAGGVSGLFYKTNDAYALSRIGLYTGLSKPQIQSGLIQLYPGQFSATSKLNDYSGNISLTTRSSSSTRLRAISSSFYSLKFYKVNAVTTFRRPFVSEDSQGNYYRSLQGGIRTGFGLDAQKQISDKHLFKYGMKYNFLHPVFSYASPVYGAESIGPIFTNTPNSSDIDSFPGGYLRQERFHQPDDPGVPDDRDNESPGHRVLRHRQLVAQQLAREGRHRAARRHLEPPDPRSGQEPGVSRSRHDVGSMRERRTRTSYEPRIAVSYQMGRNDALRASFARSVEIPPIADIDDQIDPAYFRSLPTRILRRRRESAAPPPIRALASHARTRRAGLGEPNFNAIPIQPARTQTTPITTSRTRTSSAATSRAPDAILPARLRCARSLLDGAHEPDNQRAAERSGHRRLPVRSIHRVEPRRHPSTSVELYLSKDNPNRASQARSPRRTSTRSPTSSRCRERDFFPSIPATSAALGNRPRRLPVAVPDDGRHRVQDALGLPHQPGHLVQRGLPDQRRPPHRGYVGSTPFNLVNTNVTNSFGAGQAPAYVDPQNPGSVFNPNVAATRGTWRATPRAAYCRRSASARTCRSSTRRRTHRRDRRTVSSSRTCSTTSTGARREHPVPARRQRHVRPQTGQIVQTVQFPGVGFGNTSTTRGSVISRTSSRRTVRRGRSNSTPLRLLMEFSLQRFSRLAALAVMGALAAGCTSGQSAVEPIVSQADLNANTLQFAVGTANIFGTSTGLNTVVTFRQSNGLSATLLNTPTITGPSGFLVNAPADATPTRTASKTTPVTTAGADSKTNHISASAIPAAAGLPFTGTTFDLAGGAFAYGFSPENSTSAGSATYTLYRSPMYFVAPPVRYSRPLSGRWLKTGTTADRHCTRTSVTARSRPVLSVTARASSRSRT